MKKGSPLYNLFSRRAVGPLPIVDLELKEAAEAEAAAENGPSVPQVVTRTRITADGTYATESVYTTLGEFHSASPLDNVRFAAVPLS